MGLEIKQNKKGEFSLISTITDERLHDKKWISESEAKKILIEDLVWDTYQNIIKIDRCFPKAGYAIDGIRKTDKEIIDAYFKEMESINTENGWGLIIDKIREIKAKLRLEVLDIIRYNEPQAESSYRKDVNRLKDSCTKLWNLNIMRKAQITSWNKLLGKLLKENRITREELREYAITKEEMRGRVTLNEIKS